MAFDKAEWKPNARQELFLSLPTTIKEGFYGGGAGSGKSDVLLMYCLVRGWYKNPRFKQVFQRRTFPELKREIVPRSREIYTRFGATWNGTDMVWTFPREDQIGSGGRMGNAGAMIFLGHCEHESDVHDYDSMEINLYTPDELTSFTQYIYEYIGFTRVRTSDENLPAIIRGAGMPGGIGHNFVKSRFVEPFKQGGKILVGKGGNKRIYIHSTLADNPYIDKGYSQSLDALNEAERKAKKFGDWDAYLGQVFEEFRTRHYLDEPENALHVIEPFNIPSWWPKILVIDWGFAAMTYVSWSAVSPSGRVYTYREQHWLKTKISEWGPLVKYYMDKEHPRIVKVCKSASQDRGQEHTIQQQIEAVLDTPVELSNNSAGSRIAGKALMHEYLRWKPKPIVPIDERPDYDQDKGMWIFRNKGEQAYREYLRSFDPPSPEINLPKWQIFCCEADNHEGHEFCCPTLITSIQACSYDKPRNNKVAEDVAEFEGDDPYDNSRYLLDTVDRYVREASDEFKKIQKQDALVQTLQGNNDWTMFYRNSRTLEANEVTQEPLRRFSRRRH